MVINASFINISVISQLTFLSRRRTGIMIIAVKIKHSNFANIWKLHGQCFRMSNNLFENFNTSWISIKTYLV
jgi:hypothetical protein